MIVGEMAIFSEERISVSLFSDTLHPGDEIQRIAEDTSTLMVATGAYVNLEGIPIGFSVLNGKIINPNFSLFDALLLSCDKQLNILNLSLSEPFNQNYPENFASYRVLMDAATTKGCWAIQLPLLAWNNKYLVNIYRSAYQLRETRFLLELCDETQNKYRAIADFSTPDFLPNVSLSLFQMLQQNGYTVESMVLLDTGFFNYLCVRDYQGHLQRQFSQDMFKKSIHFIQNIVYFENIPQDDEADFNRPQRRERG